MNDRLAREVERDLELYRLAMDLRIDIDVVREWSYEKVTKWMMAITRIREIQANKFQEEISQQQSGEKGPASSVPNFVVAKNDRQIPSPRKEPGVEFDENGRPWEVTIRRKGNKIVESR